MSASKYAEWSKDQLITKILELDQQLQRSSAGNTQQQASSTGTQQTVQKELETSGIHKNEDSNASTQQAALPAKKVKPPRPFQLEKTIFLAFRFAYCGWDYNGLAYQTEPTPLPTVEGKIFEALLKAHLIESPATCNFSRCGRTDKGVSAMGQVISLNVRHSERRPIVYCDVLNRILPSDIRITGYAVPPPEFNARFSCKQRHYKYLFTKSYPGGTLDIDRMNEAAALYLGEHDFRNFCKIDASKQITNYHRRILSSKIICVDPTTELYAFDLQGTAFLWHQVRCMVAVLFLVGQHLEPVSIISDLLDIQKVQSKPIYDMASEFPLILYDCMFDNIEWGLPTDVETTAPRITKHLYEKTYHQWHTLRIREQIASFMLDIANQRISQYGILQNTGSSVNIGEGELKTSKRARQESVEVVNERYKRKKGLGKPTVSEEVSSMNED
ncbi:tRNA-pseudouridine synthase [Schizosaccharomyces cryophilus OY26]|uniref:tRNA-pseudouridine synthase n=1 Tax=Schizosaccharomyces cryophilus (strain OY26 / ATCC MYA-4695 / CBS 11777 / NBRC 106824 / NRRL Y48691) TaxID=653667 RepID=S9W059_SCHCR|nr:tRNA-pseudouridine synthase [Schizosaccharomyces cryophilus OY26]EPY51420.1 tRNA-pseudouridine synthase [Schizosaccharomyces cryophilus OY26]